MTQKSAMMIHVNQLYRVLEFIKNIKSENAQAKDNLTKVFESVILG